MKNFFYDNRMKIKEIADEKKVDVGIATDIFRAEHEGEYGKNELKTWLAMIRKYQMFKNLTLADLFK